MHTVRSRIPPMHLATKNLPRQGRTITLVSSQVNSYVPSDWVVSTREILRYAKTAPLRMTRF
jgi:hypothetical protein